MKHHSEIKSIAITLLKKEKILSLTLLITIMGSILFSVFPPLVLKKIVNCFSSGQAVLLSLTLTYFAFIVFVGIFDAAKEIMITKYGQKITHEVRSVMYKKLSRLPSGYFIDHEAGTITSRMVNDVDTIDALFSNGIISMIVDSGKVLSIIIVIFFISTGLGFIILFITPILFLLTRYFQKRMLKAQLENRIAIGKVNNHVPETIKNIRMVHSFAKENYMEKKYNSYIEESYHALEKSNFYDSIYSPIIIYISAIVISILMVFSSMGGTMQTFFGMDLGSAVAIIAYVGKVFDPLESIGMEIQNIQSALAGIKRINEFLHEPEKKAQEETMNITAFTNSSESDIRFDQVDFSYSNLVPVVEHLTFQVSSGEMVTFVGRTGAGKSTVFRLILGMYESQKGSITICGNEASLIPDKLKRKLFGYVEQSFPMVLGTIAQQISLFDPSISDEQIIKAAKLVGMHEHILALEKGYETMANMNLFSQGQFQLLSIARAVVAEPKIMLLDEITANLDSSTEQAVIAALLRASKNRTVLSISHRMYEQTTKGKLITL